MTAKPVPYDALPIADATRDPIAHTHVILWNDVHGWDTRTSVWVNGEWRHGRGAVFHVSSSRDATHYRLATENEVHLDHDFEESQMPNPNLVK